MNLEKLTDRAKGFVQAAQTIAIREQQQRIAPEHLLKALLDDPQGMAAGLMTKAGGDAAKARAANDTLVAKIPAVTGSGAQGAPGIDAALLRIMDSAEQLADKAGDSFVTVERLLLALSMAAGTPVAAALSDAGLTADAQWPHRRQCRRGGTL
jgi:ATP-dependent Clp protease ATP-binding subunit ClpB